MTDNVMTDEQIADYERLKREEQERLAAEEQEILMREGQERLMREEQERFEAEEQAREQARFEHERFLDSFPETTVFYDRILSDGDTQWLGQYVRDPHVADGYGIIDNHYDESELTLVGTIYYIKGHEKPAETREEFIARRESEIVSMVQELIDSTAQQKRYDTGESCCSYVGDPDEEFNADAVAFQAWRGRCWRTCYNILNSVTAGTVPPEDVTDEYVIERLPVMEWPDYE